MLAYGLAIAIAIGSFAFYLVAFFLPEVHRRQDFVWSGVGLFYALVLWFCAGRLTGAVLLGQLASGALVLWLGWQTLALRWALTPPSVRTPTSWPQVQQRWQALQTQVTGYGKNGSLVRAIAAVGRDLTSGWEQLRQRIAGPRGQTARDRTPLNQPPAAPSPVAATSSATRSTTVPTTPQTPPADPAAAPGATASAPPPETPGPLTLPLANGLPPAIKQVMVVKDWVGDVLKGFKRTKPKRAVIDIPPRPSVVDKAALDKTAIADLDPQGETTPDPQANAEAPHPQAVPGPDAEDTPADPPPEAPPTSTDGAEVAPVGVASEGVDEGARAIAPPDSADVSEGDLVATATTTEETAPSDATNWVDEEDPTVSASTMTPDGPERPDAVEKTISTGKEPAATVEEAAPTAEAVPHRWVDEEDRNWVDEEPLAPPSLGIAPTAESSPVEDTTLEATPDLGQAAAMEDGRDTASPSTEDPAHNWDDEEANWPD